MSKKQTIHLTNDHGSMEPQQILQQVEHIEKEKEEKFNQKKNMQEAKQREKGLFYKFKSICICDGICDVKDLKECPVYHKIKCPVCSKPSCCISGKKTVMILPAKPNRARTGHDSLELESTENEWEEDEFSILDTADEDADSDNDNVEDRGILQELLSVWSKLPPLVQESEIVDEWFAGIYETKNNKKFCIGCLLKRFLKDEEGDIESTEVFEAKRWQQHSDGRHPRHWNF